MCGTQLRLRHRGSSSKADLRIETNKRESKEETCQDDLVINYRSVSSPSLENYLLCPPPTTQRVAPLSCDVRASLKLLINALLCVPVEFLKGIITIS